MWSIRASVDAFTCLGHLIGNKHLSIFKKVLTQVFSSTSSSPSNPSELFQRNRQNPGGYSDWLREGLATTLLQIATLHEQADLKIPGTTPQKFTDELVSLLPGLSSDYRFIESLQSQLPLLAEAAPDPLLSALESLLKGNNNSLVRIFDENQGFLTPSSNHINLLWALELIAWDPNRLNRTTLVLAQLAKIDPGGKLTNRPINSLRNIFLSWSPNTNANVSLRLAALEEILEQVPEIAWDLLVKLFPKNHDTSSPTMTPKYREFGASEKEPLTYAMVWDSQKKIVTLALDIACHNSDRINKVISSFSCFDQELRELSINTINEYLNSELSENKIGVWKSLCAEYNRNKRFINADWSLSEVELARLNDIIEKNRPDTIIPNITYLFDDWHIDVSESFNRNSEELAIARNDAIAQLKKKHGLEGVIGLSKTVKFPQLVASSLINISDHPIDIKTLITLATQSNNIPDVFVTTLSGSAAHKFKGEWIGIFENLISNGVIKKPSVIQHLLAWPNKKLTWNIAAQSGSEVEKEYWQSKNPHPLSTDLSDIIFSINQYLRFDSSIKAIEVIHSCPEKIPIALLLQVMNSAIPELNAGKKADGNMLSFYLKHIFEFLDEHIEVPEDVIAKFEYAYFPLIERDRSSLVIYKIMAEKPSFYVSILRDVYKGEFDTEEDSSEQKKARAQASYRLLTSFDKLPGEDNGIIDLSILESWIRAVQTLSNESGREAIGNLSIGKLLAHSPANEMNNYWPTDNIQALIDELKSDDIDQGIITERFNMRGVYSKALYEGGKQERALAEKYKKWAKQASKHSRTSSLLMRISEGWEHDAERADIRAEQDKARN